MNENKVCIISLIGKTQLLPNQSKAWKLNSLINTNYFKPLLLHKNNLDIDKQQYQAFGIDTYHDTKNRVIYIHLESIYDTNNALEILFENSESKTFFEIWENEHIKYLRSILLLFSISHIVIMSSPSCEFDIGYIRFFRIIETLRNKMLPQLVDLIKSLNLPIGKDWLYAGRPCSPRVLFTFENCPTDLFGGVEGLNENSKQAKMIEKLQHSLEDQIYNSLRKSYVITNISNNSLFSIPANQEFAYIHRLSVNNSVDTNRFLLSNLFMECSRAKEVAANSTNFLSHLRQQHHQQSSTMNQQNYLSNQIINNEGLDAKLFRKFVFEHVKTAMNEGFNDNIGRTNVQPVFELPTVNCFEKLFDALCDFFLNEPKSSKIKQQYAQIKSHVDTESQFSENRCKKVLPTALSLYQENLPGHFTKSQHQQRLEKAIHFFSLQARGPMYNYYLEKLTKECIKIWTNGRQLCEAISLTQHPCIYNLHLLPNSIAANVTDEKRQEQESDKNRSSSIKNRRKINPRSYRNRSRQQQDTDNQSSNDDEINSRADENSDSDGGRDDIDDIDNNDDENDNNDEDNNVRSRHKKKSSKPSIKQHNSNIVTIAASNCGEFQSERKDPFDLKEANYTFYEEFVKLAISAKKKHIQYEFKTNQVATRLDNNLFGVVVQSVTQKETTTTKESQPFSYNNLSQEASTTGGAIKNNELFSSPLILNEQRKTNSNEKLSIQPQSTSPTRNNVISNLNLMPPRMTHSESPIGIMPEFNSWSLVNIGKHSQYNVHNGLNQPGLLANHNHLIPWDIVVTKHSAIASVDKQFSRKNMNNYKKNSETNQQQTDFLLQQTVRGYIGMEYECPCGHRFFCSGPDKISKVTSNGNVKDDAYKLLYENMPLYTACPCRNSKDSVPYMAQMMRVFIVTPVSYNVNLTESKNTYSSSSSASPSRRTASPNLNSKQNSVKISIQINPQVQPNPSSPIFFPNCLLPIHLTENSIWVLRLPYIYMSDSVHPYYRPKDFETLKGSRVLKGMFSAVVLEDIK